MNDKQRARKEAFEVELRALLNKHDVELCLTDDGRSYGMHSPVLEFQFDSIIFPDSGELICEDFDVDLNEFDLTAQPS